MTLLCLGEALVDLICERELEAPSDADAFIPHPGGALANVAVAASRAGCESAVLGGVGQDFWGRWLRARLEEEGVGTNWMASVEGASTPLAIVVFDRHREPAFQIYGEGIRALMEAGGGLLSDALKNAGALVFGSNTLVDAPERELTMRARAEAAERSLPILFDPNLRPNRWIEMDKAVALCRDLCDGATVVKASREEAELMTGRAESATAAESICELGARIAVVTNGARGAVMRGEAEGQVAAPPVDVVAPLGAGDAFIGAFAAGLAARDWDLSGASDALPAAARAGARACTGWGAQS